MSETEFAGFRPTLTGFLNELAANNDRDWFNAHKARYDQQVAGPAFAFIRAMAPRLARVSPHFLARTGKVGGSLMRVHRDTRFAKDKKPYKTNVGIQFRHERGKDVHAPGFYVHLALDGSFLGAGTWRPDADSLWKIRSAIDADPQGWTRARDHEPFRRHGFRLGGDSLKRAPRGFDADHPLLDDLKRKDFIAICDLEPEQHLAPDFADQVGRAFAAAAPLVGFLCAALEVQF